MIKTINHSGFVVADLERSLAFYRDVVGMKITRTVDRSGPPIAQIVGYEATHLIGVHMSSGTGPTLERIQYLSPRSSRQVTSERNALGASHIAFEVDDIHAAYETLKANGAQIMNPPAELEPGRSGCYIQDPDGNWIELVEILEPAG